MNEDHKLEILKILFAIWMLLYLQLMQPIDSSTLQTDKRYYTGQYLTNHFTLICKNETVIIIAKLLTCTYKYT